MSELRRGIHGNSILQRTYDKYGPENLEYCILENVGEENRSLLFFYEQDWIERLNARSDRGGMNLSLVVDCPISSLSEDDKDRIYGSRSNPVMVYGVDGLCYYFENMRFCRKYFRIGKGIDFPLRVSSKVFRKLKHVESYADYLKQKKRLDCLAAFPPLGNKVIPKKEFEIFSPKGDLVKAVGLRSFARENRLSPESIRKVLSGKISQHKGWSLKPKEFRSFISPEGDVVSFCSLSDLSDAVGGCAKSIWSRKGLSCRGWSYEGSFCKWKPRAVNPQKENIEELKAGRNEWNKRLEARFDLVSPDGKIVRCVGVRATAEKIGCDRKSLIKLRKKERISVKGWRLAS